ncbi:hypothetical protein KATP_33180 [Kluyvera ascorbata]|nr:hypothetical protein KATP_33180 [Kluyvera ascorbata]
MADDGTHRKAGKFLVGERGFIVHPVGQRAEARAEDERDTRGETGFGRAQYLDGFVRGIVEN